MWMERQRRRRGTEGTEGNWGGGETKGEERTEGTEGNQGEGETEERWRETEGEERRRRDGGELKGQRERGGGETEGTEGNWGGRKTEGTERNWGDVLVLEADGERVLMDVFNKPLKKIKNQHQLQDDQIHVHQEMWYKTAPSYIFLHHIKQNKLNINNVRQSQT